MRNKNHEFIEACRTGNVELIKQLVNDPDIDVNFRKKAGMSYASEYNFVEIIKIILTNKGVVFDYEKKDDMLSYWEYNGEEIKFWLNPLTASMVKGNYKILDMLLAAGIKFNRKDYIDLLVKLDNEKLFEYFKKRPEFYTLVMSCGKEYQTLLPEEIKDVFLF